MLVVTALPLPRSAFSAEASRRLFSFDDGDLFFGLLEKPKLKHQHIDYTSFCAQTVDPECVEDVGDLRMQDLPNW